MVDWPGLLKFSLAHSDGTKNTQFKEMDPERRKWLQEAMSQYTMAEVRRIRQILQALHKPQTCTQQDSTKRSQLLEEMEQLIESLDRGETLYQLGGHFVILNIIFNSKYDENRIIAMRIFCFANQNDAKVQEESIRVGAFEFVQRAHTEKNVKIKEGMLSCISSLIRGENLQAKRIFIKIKGLELLKEMLLNQPTQRMKSKIYLIIKDLSFYDDRLQYTHNNLSSFTNTNSIKLKQNPNEDLQYDANKQVKNNELPENAHFKGSIKKWLSQNPEARVAYEAIKKVEEEPL